MSSRTEQPGTVPLRGRDGLWVTVERKSQGSKQTTRRLRIRRERWELHVCRRTDAGAGYVGNAEVPETCPENKERLGKDAEYGMEPFTWAADAWEGLCHAVALTRASKSNIGTEI